jgi:hypothetical protein
MVMARGDDRRRLGRRAVIGTITTLVLALAMTPDSIGPTRSAAVTPAAAATPDPAAASEPGAGAGADSGSNVVLLGDSVTEQAFGYVGGPTSDAPARLDRWSHVGWTLPVAAEHAGTAVDASSTGILVLAAGPNDAAPWDDGWTGEDVARWQDILEGVPATTCVAVVLPGWGAALDSTAWERSMQQMRTDVVGLVDDRRATGSPTVVVDWLPVVTRHPDYVAADGIHLASKAAARARQSVYWQAVDSCRSLGQD